MAIKLTAKKYQCLVLCLNKSIATKPPTPPPNIEDRSSAFSEIL